MAAKENHNSANTRTAQRFDSEEANDEAMRAFPVWVRPAFARAQRTWSPHQILAAVSECEIPHSHIPVVLAFEDAWHAMDQGRGWAHTRCEILQIDIAPGMLPIDGEDYYDWALRIGFSIREMANKRRLPMAPQGRAPDARDVNYGRMRLRKSRDVSHAMRGVILTP
jgi:hypothetical protein